MKHPSKPTVEQINEKILVTVFGDNLEKLRAGIPAFLARPDAEELNKAHRIKTDVAIAEYLQADTVFNYVERKEGPQPEPPSVGDMLTRLFDSDGQTITPPSETEIARGKMEVAYKKMRHFLAERLLIYGEKLPDILFNWKRQ